MKRIMFVTGAMGRGGAERVISVLANHYAACGCEVSILMLLHRANDYALDPGIQVLDVSDETRDPRKHLLSLTARTRSSIRQRKPDVVVAFMAQICLVVWAASIGMKQRLVFAECIDPAMARRGKIYELLLHYAYAHCDCAIMQTRRGMAYFPESVRKNAKLIPNPIRVYAQADPQPACRIVTAGRLTAQKNHRMLIRAFAEVGGRHPAYTLDIYGEGPLRAQLQEDIDRLGLGDRVRLMGNVPDLHEQIRDAAMFVLSSDFEGLSNAMLEAMMMGLPVISTSCAGADEYIEHGKNGLLVDVGDEAALAQAMEALIADPDTRAGVAAAGKASVQGLKAEVIIQAWDEAIRSER